MSAAESAARELPPNVRVVSTLAEDHDGFVVASSRAIAALEAAEQRHFWHRARNELIVSRLARLGAPPPARVVELGCGGGCVSAALAEAGYVVTGIDGHPSLVARAARRAPAASFVVHDLAQGVDALGVEPADVVGLFDVLEHLDDPAAALSHALSCARPGGLVVGTVPALMALWSLVDVHAGHRVRHDVTSLTLLLERALGARAVEGAPSAQVLEIAPFNRLLVPLMLVQRRLVAGRDMGATSEQNLAVPPAPVNLALLAALRFERRLEPALARAHVPGASLWFALRRAAS